MPGDVIVVKKRRVMLTASKQICNLDTLRGVQQQHNEEGSAVEMPTSPLDEFSELRAERDWLTARSARHRQALVAQAEREAATCGRPVGGGISALAGADVYVHGPSHSDHMAERMRYTGYFEMRNQKLAESGSKLRMGGLDTHASVYAEMSAVASASKLASGTASTLIASQSILQVSPPQIFRGVHAYFNAAKGRHSAMHLTKLLQMHGGEAMWLLSKRKTTHLICDGLSARKTESILNASHHAKHQIYTVRPSWITDSIAAGRRLSEMSYRSLVDDSQTTIKSCHSSSVTAI